MELELNLSVNGRRCSRRISPSVTLAEFLREDLHLTGCRVACDSEVCGACTVLLDGRPVAACSTFAFQAEGTRIETIEGLSNGAELHPVQQAFLETNAFQCGFCTAGLVLSVKALLEADPEPDDPTILEWLRANVCRCTGYKPILAATRLAAERMRSL
jgi:aerobic-type carbon monoxide dehydrogenase small subunit (CoxS/CutS family)